VATGAVGEIDDAGRLCVTGRRADRIVSGGTNVNPQEVEAVLVAHPAVREACVVGTPDDVWGEIVTAVIVPTLHEPEGLREWAAERLTGARRPRRWVMVEALPRTATGKVDRARVRARAAGDDGE
jgi:acyl-CoA synthetase (AMP-forming)/AMP-acid ligase II